MITNECPLNSPSCSRYCIKLKDKTGKGDNACCANCPFIDGDCGCIRIRALRPEPDKYINEARYGEQ
jgi:hypothetical protein